MTDPALTAASAARQQLIRDATLAARNSWSDYVLLQDEAILRTFEDASSEILDTINRYTVAGKVPPSRLTAIYNNTHAEIVNLRRRLNGQIHTGMRHSVDYGMKSGIRGAEAAGVPARRFNVGSSFIGADGQIRRYNAAKETYAASTWSRMNTDALNAALRWQPGVGHKLERRESNPQPGIAINHNRGISGTAVP